MTKTCVKTNVLAELQLLKQQYIQQTIEVSRFSNYVKGFNYLLKGKLKEDSLKFIEFYMDLLKLKGFPVLSLETLGFLLANYNRHVDFYKNIRFFAALDKATEGFDGGVWHVLMKALCKTGLQQKRIQERLKVLAIILSENRDKLKDHNLQGLIVPFLNPAFNKSFYFVKEGQHLMQVYGLFIYWANNIFKHGCLVSQHLHHLTTVQFNEQLKWMEWNEEVKELVEFLENRLPANYLMLHLPQRKIERLNELYQWNKDFFRKNEEVSTEDLLKVKEKDCLLQPFFKKMVLPQVFFRCFYSLTNVQKDLFRFVLNGESVRKYGQLPLTMDKKACHELRNQQLYLDIDFWGYFVVAKLMSLGVSPEFAKQVNIVIQRHQGNMDYWINTFSLLFKKGLTDRPVTEVGDYLNEKILVKGEFINIKGISIINLMNKVLAWHREMQLIRFHNCKLPQSDIKSFKHKHEDGSAFVIKQLTSTLDLHREGFELNHCVYSYANACKLKRSFIFSLRLKKRSIETPVITIEVRKNKIVQLRGAFNRRAEKHELEIIKLWAEQENLSLAS